MNNTNEQNTIKPDWAVQTAEWSSCVTVNQ